MATQSLSLDIPAADVQDIRTNGNDSGSASGSGSGSETPNNPRQQDGDSNHSSQTTSTPTTRRWPGSDSSDEGIRMTPAAARRFARRNLRRNSPTPDLVTSLVRPPSSDTLFVPTQSRHDAQVRDGHDAPFAGANVVSSTSPGRRTGPMLSPHQSSLDIPRRYGGHCVFDMYSLNYVTEPDSSLLCPICHDPLVDPVTTPCDHTFCYLCLRQSIASSPSGTTCPIDRDSLVWGECFSAARLVRTQLNNLVVKCPNSSRGCTRELRREYIETHATSECRFRDYPCPNTLCEKRVRSKPSDDACLHRLVDCHCCGEEVEAADRDFHLLSCPMSMTRCQNCWELVCRSRLDQHNEIECEDVEIVCPYQDVGCPTRCARGEMSAHTRNCAFHPNTASGIIIRSQQEVIRSYGDFGSQLQEMVARQNETTAKIQDITATLGRRDPGDVFVNDNRTIQDLDAGFEEIHQNLTQLEARQSMWTLNQVMPIREEVTELRNNINMIRMHVTWLLNRSREEGRHRAANNPTTSARPSESGYSLPEARRRSSSTDTDLPRL